MEQIILTTNFSDASRNALDYACALLSGQEFEFLLLHVYTMPIVYTGDMAGMPGSASGMDDIQTAMEAELDRLKGCHPDIKARGRIMLGGFNESVRNQIREGKPALLVMGMSGDEADMWSWDSIILNGLRDLPVPVLVVPKGLQYRPVREIAYACNYCNVGRQTPFEDIRQILGQTGARLHLVHVHTKDMGAHEEQGLQLLQDQLSDGGTVYHTLQEGGVVEAISHYISDAGIDLLIVVPKRHGFWADLFHKSNTKALARLQQVPVLALREQQEG